MLNVGTNPCKCIVSLLQYVRVMAEGAQCIENGPFFATTPRVVIQNGIAISRDIVIMPDWVLIGAMLGSFALLVVVLTIGLVSEMASITHSAIGQFSSERFTQHALRISLFLGPFHAKLFGKTMQLIGVLKRVCYHQEPGCSNRRQRFPPHKS